MELPYRKGGPAAAWHNRFSAGTGYFPQVPVENHGTFGKFAEGCGLSVQICTLKGGTFAGHILPMSGPSAAGATHPEGWNPIMGLFSYCGLLMTIFETFGDALPKWVWVSCVSPFCGHSRAVPLAPWRIRWGAEDVSSLMRR